MGFQILPLHYNHGEIKSTPVPSFTPLHGTYCYENFLDPPMSNEDYGIMLQTNLVAKKMMAKPLTAGAIN